MPEQVRRGACMHCGEAALVQMAWVKYGATAQQRWMCRRCWRILQRQGGVISPQTAGKRIKKYERLMQTEWCRHGMPEEGCRICRREQRNRDNREQRALDQQRAFNQALDQHDPWREISTAVSDTSYWSLTPPPIYVEPIEPEPLPEPIEDEVEF